MGELTGARTDGFQKRETTRPKLGRYAPLAKNPGTHAGTHITVDTQTDFGSRPILAGVQTDYEQSIVGAIRSSHRLRRPRAARPIMKHHPTVPLLHPVFTANQTSS